VKQQRRPLAFISCSTRQEDRPFVELVEAIIKRFGFRPAGTVGRHSASPRPIWEQMRDGIRSTDCVVLVATPRYIQQDIHDRKKTGRGISELLHVEVGMAISSDRPVLAFVLEGTDVGSFLPQVIQFISLRMSDGEDLRIKWPLIANYFRSALVIIEERWRKEKRTDLLSAVGWILGTIGAAALIDGVFDKHDKDDFL
jgi:hypothetical protein